MRQRFSQSIRLDGKEISESSSVFIIAEAGVNHGGSIELAKRLVDVAADAKADAVKFQAFKSENLILHDVDKAPYQQETAEPAETQFAMLKRLEVTKANNIEIRDYCCKRGITFLTTPFDEESLAELEEIDMPAYKVASTDTTNLMFIREIAKTGKPVILSTGMSYMTEVELALDAIAAYNNDLILLQCTANYPIADDEANLAVLDTFKRKFGCLVGYSDHSVGIGAAPYAVPMGAKVIEKHFTLDKSLDGPDHRTSLDPHELSAFVRTIRRVETYMGNGLKYPAMSEVATRASLQKCLVARQPIKAGDIFKWENVTSKRTGGVGTSPIYWASISGKVATRDYAIDQLIQEE